jgi:processive 1,2-diacylglycerol beta-glucosyltransferase
MRIQILTAAFGDGHNTAAHNVAAALDQVSNGAVEAPVVDAIAQGNPISARFLQQGYQLAITSLPGIWRLIYQQTEKFDVTKGRLEIFNGVLDELEATLSDHNPGAIVSSFPLYSGLVRRLDSKIPLFTVITDSISVHRAWTATPSDLHFVTDARSKSVAQSLGLSEESIVVTGFPVSLKFSNAPAQPRTQLKRLLWITSTHTRNAVKTLRSLLNTLPQDIELTIVLGRLANRLAGPFENVLADEHQDRVVRLHHWHNDVPGLMKSHDFLITKAGGASTHEAFAASLPTGINYVVPGQEEGNAQLCVERGCGIRLESSVKTGATICDLIDSGHFKELAAAAARESINSGAIQIARTILERLKPGSPSAATLPKAPPENLRRARELASHRPVRILS